MVEHIPNTDQAMHIAVFTDYYLPTLGGVQTHIKAQREAMEEAGHRVTIFTPLESPSDDPGIRRLPTHRFIKPDGFPFAWSPHKVRDYAIRELPDIGADVVHVHSDMAAALGGLMAARTIGLPSVQTVHGRIDVYVPGVVPVPALTTIGLAKIHGRHMDHTDSSVTDQHPYTSSATARRLWRMMVSQANYADHVIVPSQHFGKKLIDQGVHKPLTVLSNGIEDSVLQKLHDVEPRSYKHGERLDIMWCARVSPEKRPIQFLEAIRSLQDKVHVSLYGDGVTFSDVRRYVQRHGLKGSVALHGAVPQDEILQAMRRHHLFISTSAGFDNQPMTMLEAIAAGLPVLYCDGDMAEFLPKHGARLTASSEPAGIAATIRDVMADPESIASMSRSMLAARDGISQQSHLQRQLKIYAGLRGTRHV